MNRIQVCNGKPGCNSAPRRSSGPLLCLGLGALAMVLIARGASQDAGSNEVSVPARRTETELRVNLEKVEVEDDHGRTVRPFAGVKAQFHVLLFLTTDCPICNRYAPEIARLSGDYTSRGVRFWMVHPLAGESAEAVRRHATEYRLPGGILRDPHRVLTHPLGVTVTPEAVVLNAEGVALYRGRIDDRFPELGRQRAAPVHRDLRDALDAALEGKAVERSRTSAVGCAIPARETK